MLRRTLTLVSLASLQLVAAATAPAWDRLKAFEYLEARQQEWAEWEPAKMPGGACVSCHTGLSYLIARRVIGEKQPRPVERDLVQGVRHRMISKETMLDEPGAEAVLSLFTLATQRRDRNQPVTEPEKIALKNLLAIQQKGGGQNDGGGWTWFKNRLHPVESEEGAYFGSTLAAWALAAYPASATAKAMPALQAYLERESPRQPLHHRLAWVTFAPGIKQKDATLRELWTTQQSDGGFTSASLGPWSKQEKAAPDTGSNPYATAWAAFTAREAGVSCSDPGLKRALDWLERKQDPTTGAWPTQSMNKVHEKGSTQSKFMTDATTGFAAAALIGCKREGIIQSTTVR